MPNYNTCGQCQYLDLNSKTSVGYVCVCKNKCWRSTTAHLKQRSAPACKQFCPKAGTKIITKENMQKKLYKDGYFTALNDFSRALNTYSVYNYNGKPINVLEVARKLKEAQQ